MLKVAVEEILQLQARRREINTTPLERITFFKGGFELKVDPVWVEEFRFTGLSNVEFIMNSEIVDGVLTGDLTSP